MSLQDFKITHNTDPWQNVCACSLARRASGFLPRCAANRAMSRATPSRGTSWLVRTAQVNQQRRRRRRQCHGGRCKNRIHKVVCLAVQRGSLVNILCVFRAVYSMSRSERTRSAATTRPIVVLFAIQKNLGLSVDRSHRSHCFGGYADDNCSYANAIFKLDASSGAIQRHANTRSCHLSPAQPESIQTPNLCWYTIEPAQCACLGSVQSPVGRAGNRNRRFQVARQKKSWKRQSERPRDGLSP